MLLFIKGTEKMKTKYIVITLTIVISITLIALFCVKYFSPTLSCPSNLINEYEQLSMSNNLKFDKYSDALNHFRKDNPNICPQSIDTFVPGKIPHEDGNPYFIGRGVINKKENTCTIGYMNLVTGQVKTWEDVCVINN
jgi:hypothetical protein